MDLLPAIDLRGGRCVRLHQGDYDAETVYGDDPVEQALAFVAAGARWVHTVDLDAARTGEPVNRGVIRAMAAAVAAVAPGARLQCGGGVRGEVDAAQLLDAGVARVVLGSAAVAEPALAVRLARRHPGMVAVGLDHRGGDVRTHGWTASSGRSLLALVDELTALAGGELGAFVVTDIARDGVLGGPDLQGYRELLGRTTVPLVASGGIGGVDDVVALAALDVDGRRLAGAIAGKALYEGRLDLARALRALAEPPGGAR